VVKPTHMIGGYAQLAYGFNYYGTVGSNRDEFVVVRKLAKVEWRVTAVDSAEEAPVLHQDDIAVFSESGSG
jgi:nitrate reductase alpha subunit